MSDLITVLFVIGALALVGGLTWPLLRTPDALSPPPLVLRAIRITRIVSLREVEMELSDGRVYRRGDVYSDWFLFPDGTKADTKMWFWLRDEFDRLENLDRWSGSDGRHDVN